MHVLMIEDDQVLASGVVQGLSLHGMTVDHAADCQSARSMMRQLTPDVIILDLALPDGDGLDLLREWRRAGMHCPVLILTARDTVSQRIDGLDSGADDYLLKPFDLGELAARLQALLRRAAGTPSPEIVHGCLTYQPARQAVMLEGVPVALSRRERTLLEKLLYARGTILTEEQLKDALYGLDTDIGSNALNVHIHHLRRKLGRSIVETVRGVGYRLGPADGDQPEGRQ